MKLLSALVITILLLQASVGYSFQGNAADANIDDQGGNDIIASQSKHHPMKINCNKACTRRCKKSSRQKACHRTCKSCCLRCGCVPSGTHGNKSECPCYAKLRTHDNKPKCP